MENKREDIMTALIENQQWIKKKMMLILNRLKTQQKAMKFLNIIKEMTKTDLVKMATQI